MVAKKDDLILSMQEAAQNARVYEESGQSKIAALWYTIAHLVDRLEKLENVHS